MIYPVVMAKGVHLFPSRTQKLSPYTSKVLGWKRPGRIDSCRLEQIRHTSRYALFVYCYRVSIRPGYPEGMSHLALQRVWHSTQSASESPFSGEPAGEGNKRDSELSQNMRPNREHMERAYIAAGWNK